MEDSKIQWTDDTFNIAWGCEKVSEACKFCYAESQANRWRKKDSLPMWGPGSERRPMSEAYWRQPISWNKAAEQANKPRLVFCSSMADVFEDHPQLVAPRARLFELIKRTRWLRWLLLTKRPENMIRLARDAGWAGAWPRSVWAGTTVENQRRAEERIPELLKVPASVHFLSCEPMLGPLNLRDLPANVDPLPGKAGVTDYFCGLTGRTYDSQLDEFGEVEFPCIDWVICGGESGRQARAFDLSWARSLQAQCKAAGTPFFFKQLGAFPVGRAPEDGACWTCRNKGDSFEHDHSDCRLTFDGSHGGDLLQIPEDLRVREWPAKLAGADQVSEFRKFARSVKRCRKIISNDPRFGANVLNPVLFAEAFCANRVVLCEAVETIRTNRPVPNPFENRWKFVVGRGCDNGPCFTRFVRSNIPRVCSRKSKRAPCVVNVCHVKIFHQLNRNIKR